MDIEFDPEKSARNERIRGLPFALVVQLDWDHAISFIDNRSDYGEERIVAIVPHNIRLYVVCYVIRANVRRIISFRKANKRERRAYGEAISHE